MQTDELDAGAARLGRPFRIIRMLRPPDAPWPGTLARRPDDSACVLVDADALGPRWRGWDAAASDHVLTPLDIVRRPGGHEAMLPVLTERVDAFLSRRSAAGSPLSAGEVVTLAVSVMRGALALPPRTGADDRGQWWLTADARPVLVPGVGDEAVEASRDVLLRTQAELRPRSSLALLIPEIVTAVGDPRLLARDMDALEEALFAAADAEPLAVAALAPRRVQSLVAPPDEAARPARQRSRRARWNDLLAAQIDFDLGDLASQTATGLWRRLRAGPRRRRPWLLAGGAAAAVLAVGLLWPTGDGGEAASAEGGPSATQEPSPAAATTEVAPAPTPTGEPAAEQEDGAADAAEDAAGDEASDPWTAALDEILAVRASCGAATACLADVVEDARRGFPPGVIDLPSTGRTATLLDDFGGAAVLRVDPVESGGISQLVVLVQDGERYLLRDVHDVAEQAR